MLLQMIQGRNVQLHDMELKRRERETVITCCGWKPGRSC